MWGLGCSYLLVLAAAGAAGVGPDDFCDRYLAPVDNSTAAGLHWAKTLNSFDYGFVERSKFLYCCAVGASSIRWFKDGRPLQMTGEDDFRQYPNRPNDTIWVPRVVMANAGNYTCEASNGTHLLTHTITLNVDVEQNYHGKPIRTAVPKDQYAYIGESAEMFCEAFIGSGPDTIALSEVVWVKVGEGMKFASREGGRIIEYTYRDDNQTQGAFLRFYNITDKDFGTYICKIENDQSDFALVFNATLYEGEDPNLKVRYQTSYQHTIIVLAVFVAFSVAIVAVVTRFRLEIQLFWKDRFGKLEDDGKEYDVFVCYDGRDSEFVHTVLVATLEQKFQYRCFAYERDSIAGDFITETYCRTIRASRRFLMVLSPSLACNAWCTYALYIAVKAMLNLQSKIICVVLQNVSWPASGEQEQDPTLQHVLRVVKKVRWEEEPRRPIPLMRGNSRDDMVPQTPNCSVGSPRFWTALRLVLPPRRPTTIVV